MGRKQNKSATQRKKCTIKNEDDESGTDCCSCKSLPCACNGENNEKEVYNSMGLEENLKINVEDQFKKKESII